MRNVRLGSRRVVLAGAALVAVVAVGAVRIGASTPPSDQVTVPAKAGQTVTVTWTGTIPVAATPTSDCNDAVLVDDHLIDRRCPGRVTTGSTRASSSRSAGRPRRRRRPQVTRSSP